MFSKIIYNENWAEVRRQSKTSSSIPWSYTDLSQCNINVATSDIFNSIQPDLNSCMEACSVRGSGENTDPCQAVAWNTNDKRCWMKGRGVTAEQGTTSDVTIMAFSDPAAWENLPSGCGYDNETVVEDPHGQQFRVLCDVRYKGDNYDPSIRPSYPAKNTKTLEECLQYCSEGSPFCWGVLFSPTQESGYYNCYAKTANATTKPTSWVEQQNMITAYALSDVNSTCSGGTFTASNGAKFNTSCDSTGDSDNVDTVHADNFEECQDACAKYTPSSGGAACKGVLYQPNAQDGWLNCYLKYGLSNVTHLGEWHLAVLESDATNSGGSSGGSSSNTGAIAGGVVGGVAAIAIIGGLFFWYRKRKARANAAGFHPQNSTDASDSEQFNSTPQGYPMKSPPLYGGADPYNQMQKHDYMPAPTTPHNHNSGAAEMDANAIRETSELPAGREMRHEMQG